MEGHRNKKPRLEVGAEADEEKVVEDNDGSEPSSDEGDDWSRQLRKKPFKSSKNHAK